MVVFDSLYTRIDGVTPKVVETGNGFLLNTQYYLKNNLSPVPFECAKVTGSSYQLNLVKTLYCKSYSWNRSYKYCPPIKDNYVAGKYYVIHHNGFIESARQMFITQFNESDSKCKMLKASLNMGDVQFIEYVYQTEDFVWTTCMGNLTWYLCKYSKATGANTTCFSIVTTASRPFPVLLYTSDQYFYFACYENANIVITRYDRIANTKVSASIRRGGSSSSSTVNSTMTMQAIKLNDNEYGVYAYNLENPQQPIGLYFVDITKPFSATWADACTYSPCVITWNEDKTEIGFNSANPSLNTYYDLFTHKVGNKTYLEVCVHNKEFENVSNINYQGIYTFEIEDTSDPLSLTFSGYCQPTSAQQVNGYMFDATNTVCIAAIDSGFKVYKFSSISHSFEYTGADFADISNVGIDANGRLWYTKIDGSVHITNLNDAQDVEITFEHDVYEYTGSTINTYITFEAKTFLGEDASGLFKLTMEGPAIFTETNNREYTLSYTQKVNIPIRITGAAPITVYPKYVTRN